MCVGFQGGRICCLFHPQTIFVTLFGNFLITLYYPIWPLIIRYFMVKREWIWSLPMHWTYVNNNIVWGGCIYHKISTLTMFASFPFLNVVLMEIWPWNCTHSPKNTTNVPLKGWISSRSSCNLSNDSQYTTSTKL